MKTRVLSPLLIAAALAWTLPAAALEVNIAEFLPYVDIEYGGKNIRIMRIQDAQHTLTGGFAKTSRPCPPFCFQPMNVAPGVTTVGEVEVVRFIGERVARKTALLIDSRTPDWFEQGTIPGAINIPFFVYDEENRSKPEFARAMQAMGVRPATAHQTEVGFWDRIFRSADTSRIRNGLDFSGAKDVLLFCNGPWCEQSPRAIRGLLAVGYPAEKIHYYRGGMQLWQMGGFTTVVPEVAPPKTAGN